MDPTFTPDLSTTITNSTEPSEPNLSLPQLEDIEMQQESSTIDGNEENVRHLHLLEKIHKFLEENKGESPLNYDALVLQNSPMSSRPSSPVHDEHSNDLKQLQTATGLLMEKRSSRRKSSSIIHSTLRDNTNNSMHSTSDTTKLSPVLQIIEMQQNPLSVGRKAIIEKLRRCLDEDKGQFPFSLMEVASKTRSQKLFRPNLTKGRKRPAPEESSQISSLGSTIVLSTSSLATKSASLKRQLELLDLSESPAKKEKLSTLECNDNSSPTSSQIDTTQ